MSDPELAGRVDHLISVSCDLANNALLLGDPRVAIKPGDGVTWEFLNLPIGWSPWIEFRSDPATDGSFLGPFTGLTQSSASLWGQCRDDLKGCEMTYRISIQKGIGAGWESGMTVINSRAGILKVQSAGSAKNHRFEVRLDASQGLQVSPLQITLDSGDTVEWTFEDLPPNVEANAWRPIVHFMRYDGEGRVPNEYLGPFTSLETTPARVRGTGNNLVNGEYSFRISVVKVGTGELLWISSHDPVIDNRGGVVDPPPVKGQQGADGE